MGFEIGTKLLYSVHGVCSVVGIEMRTLDRKKVEYYALSPVDQPDSRFYIPTGNPAAVAKLHPLLTASELDDLVNSIKGTQPNWIVDENRRKQHYRDLMCALDRQEMFRTVVALMRHKQEQTAAGKKLHMCDENFLRDAQKLICGEFSLVLGMPKNEIGDYIQKRLTE